MVIVLRDGGQEMPLSKLEIVGNKITHIDL